MPISDQAIKILSLLAEKPCYVREVSKRVKISTSTTVKWLRKFKAMGLAESFKQVEGKGKPCEYYFLSSLGRELCDVLESAKFRETLFTLKRMGIPACAGIGCSCSFWGAPIILRRLDILVRDIDEHKAEKIVEARGFGLNGTLINDFYERTIMFNGLRNLSLEDTILHILLVGDVRLTLFIPIMISKNKVDYNLLFSLSSRHKKVRDVGAMLEATNALKEQAMVPRGVIEMFQECAEREPIKPIYQKPHKFTFMGIVPRRKNPINTMIEKKWGVNVPTFEEMREAFDLGI